MKESVYGIDLFKGIIICMYTPFPGVVGEYM